MRFDTVDAFYKEMGVLIDELRAGEHEAEAQSLDVLMGSAWTTGSELLLELREALKKMKGQYSKELKTKIADCTRFAVNHRKILGLD